MTQALPLEIKTKGEQMAEQASLDVEWAASYRDRKHTYEHLFMAGFTAGYHMARELPADTGGKA